MREKETFGQIVRNKRISLGLTQLQVAMSSKLSPGYYYRIESKKQIPSVQTVKRISKVLSLNTDQMVEMILSLREENYSKKIRSERNVSELGRTVKESRMKNNLTVRQLASKIGVSHEYISSIERSEGYSVSDKVILKLSDILGIDSDKLFFLAGKIPPDVSKKVLNAPSYIIDLIREHKNNYMI